MRKHSSEEKDMYRTESTRVSTPCCVAHVGHVIFIGRSDSSIGVVF